MRNLLDCYAHCETVNAEVTTPFYAGQPQAQNVAFLHLLYFYRFLIDM